MKRLSVSIAVPALMFFIILGHASQGYTDEACPINRHIQYDNKDALGQLQKAVIPAVYDDGNIIALHILRQTMYALGQDMALEVAPEPDRTALRTRQEKLWLKAVQKMANDEDPFFQVVMGILCYRGYGVALDKNKAMDLWRRSADKRFGPAYFMLAKINAASSQGNRSGNQNSPMVAEYYRKAGDWGVPGGWYNLGCMYNTDQLGQIQLNKAMGYWEKGAAMGHAWSQYNLGFYYTQGGPGLSKNKTLGRKWLEKAANQGHMKAIYVLSKSYSTGAKAGDYFFDINLD